MADWLEQVRKEADYQDYLKIEGVKMARTFSVTYADDITRLFDDALELVNSKKGVKYFISPYKTDEESFQSSWTLCHPDRNNSPGVFSLMTSAAGQTEETLQLNVFFSYYFLGNFEFHNDNTLHWIKRIRSEDFTLDWLRGEIIESLWNELNLPSDKVPGSKRDIS